MIKYRTIRFFVARHLDLAGRGGLVFAVLLAGLAGSLGGCGKTQPYRTLDRMNRGLVIVLTGIEGRSRFNEKICEGLDNGGVNWAIELMDWTSPLGPIYNQRDEMGNRQKAAELGWRIARYHWDYPDRPVVLVGQSGGGVMAIWVAEALPKGHDVDGLILLDVSISPKYDLSLALANTRRGIVSFYSERDWFFLGMGTTISGTMDGQHSSSAGKVGFLSPTDEKGGKATYDKLFQIPWTPEMAEAGHRGMHLTSGNEEYVAQYIVPFVLSPVWDDALIKEVLDEKWARKGPAAQTGSPEIRPIFTP